ncbi:MAG: hypothetical protein AAGF12_10730 [Myxococcota bacterium]
MRFLLVGVVALAFPACSVLIDSEQYLATQDAGPDAVPDGSRPDVGGCGQCPPDSVCIGARCVEPPSCEQFGDCLPGLVCVEGRCAPCDSDGDGFFGPQCEEQTRAFLVDCDDSDGELYPGALRCGEPESDCEPRVDIPGYDARLISPRPVVSGFEPLSPGPNAISAVIDRSELLIVWREGASVVRLALVPTDVLAAIDEPLEAQSPMEVLGSGAGTNVAGAAGVFRTPQGPLVALAGDNQATTYRVAPGAIVQASGPVGDFQQNSLGYLEASRQLILRAGGRLLALSTDPMGILSVDATVAYPIDQVVHFSSAQSVVFFSDRMPGVVVWPGSESEPVRIQGPVMEVPSGRVAGVRLPIGDYVVAVPSRPMSRVNVAWIECAGGSPACFSDESGIVIEDFSLGRPENPRLASAIVDDQRVAVAAIGGAGELELGLVPFSPMPLPDPIEISGPPELVPDDVAIAAVEGMGSDPSQVFVVASSRQPGPHALWLTGVRMCRD